MTSETANHSRWHWPLAMLLICGFVGWASRHWTLPLPPPIAKRVGDALWASCIFEGIAILRPRWPTRAVAAAALGIAYSIEFGQMYHSSPQLEHLRTTLFGRLVLGSGFSWLDQIAYTVGVAAAAAAADWFCTRRRMPSNPRTSQNSAV